MSIYVSGCTFITNTNQFLKNNYSIFSTIFYLSTVSLFKEYYKFQNDCIICDKITTKEAIIQIVFSAYPFLLTNNNILNYIYF